MTASLLILWMHGLTGLQRLKEYSGQRSLPYYRWAGFSLLTAVLLVAAAVTGSMLYGARPAGQLNLRPVMERLEHLADKASSSAEEAGSGNAGTTGYGTGEGELGAPLTPGTAPVFTASVSRPVYWRGESLAYYDGRRWIREGIMYEPLSLTGLPSEEMAGELAAAGPDSSRILKQRIELAEPASGGLPLFSAGAVADVSRVELADGSKLGYVLADPQKSRLRLPESSGSAAITAYEVESLLPENNPAVLGSLGMEDPREISGQYLQLPAALPGRVSALSAELTAGAVNRYAAVAAVQSYLRSSYPYTLDTRIPPGATDFVDDFLFTAKQGYCVHFASAMTVLLRSSGIPARYVQGYGPGTPERGGTRPARFLVTQADAHAWVEVYFPGAGWVPFDPTPGTAFAAAGRRRLMQRRWPRAAGGVRAQRRGRPARPAAGGRNPGAARCRGGAGARRRLALAAEPGPAAGGAARRQQGP